MRTGGPSAPSPGWRRGRRCASGPWSPTSRCGPASPAGAPWPGAGPLTARGCCSSPFSTSPISGWSGGGSISFSASPSPPVGAWAWSTPPLSRRRGPGPRAGCCPSIPRPGTSARASCGNGSGRRWTWPGGIIWSRCPPAWRNSGSCARRRRPLRPSTFPKVPRTRQRPGGG